MVRRLFHRAKMNFTSTRVLIYALILLIPLGNIGLAAPGDHLYYLPVIDKYTEYSGSPTDWPQLGHDAQRTNASPAQINPPYCYAWKWDAVPIASRLQPVVSAGRLFVGGMDGVLYARNASSGAPLWHFTSSGPIRNSAAVAGTRVIFSSYDGFTYALNVSDGALVWKTQTGSSATAPLIDSEHQLVFVASTNGTLSAISLLDGAAQWTYDSGAAILTSPALSGDNRLVYFGNEAVKAIALSTTNGAVQWQTTLQGQSLSDRYPVVANDTVFYRSQPLYFFHDLLQVYGDQVMDRAGSVLPDWSADWSIVRPQILNFLTAQPQAKTFFALNGSTGAPSGTAPVLYTFGNNEIPAPPVFGTNNNLYLAYRARHGIQTDSHTVHVTTEYDAELGQMSLSNLDITGLRSATLLSGQPQFRMTSDEPAVLTMSGNILLVDNWERLGGINVSNGQLIAVGNVSNNWPECQAQCGPGGANPYFPLSGNPADPAYPFPGPRSTEGNSRSGAVIANGMIYWRVVEGGLAGIAHSSSGSCSAPSVWRDSASPSQTSTPSPVVSAPLSNYVTTDLTNPNQNPPADLKLRLQNEVRALLQAANGKHLLPYYLERGFSSTTVWPYTYWNSSGKTGLASIGYQSHGSVFWFDPGELLYTLAAAYPYLGNDLQSQVRTYMASEMALYPPLQDLPYNDPSHDWLHSGSARELYQVPFRAQLVNWPPVAANIASIYSLWLWSKNTGDYSYAQSHWSQVNNLFNAHKNAVRYYADISGLIGYYRLASDLVSRDPTNASTYQAAASEGLASAVTAMTNGKVFNTYLQTANTDFIDPRNQPTGWSLPVFFGMTPEVGAYLSNEMGGQPQNLVSVLEHYNSSGKGLLWWYLTRAGVHAEDGESAYLPPTTAWSHFLAHAYIVKDSQTTLRQWLDRPWVPGDLYSIQKIVATIQAK